MGGMFSPLAGDMLTEDRSSKGRGEIRDLVCTHFFKLRAQFIQFIQWESSLQEKSTPAEPLILFDMRTNGFCYVLGGRDTILGGGVCTHQLSLSFPLQRGEAKRKCVGRSLELAGVSATLGSTHSEHV